MMFQKHLIIKRVYLDYLNREDHIMDITLTPEQSFYAMQEFLEEYFKITSSDALGALLSCMQFLEDGQTADSALWEDWLIILHNKKHITPQQAFEAMRLFLNNYYKNTSSTNIKKLLKSLDDVINNGIEKSTTWSDWMQCVNHVYKLDHSG